MVQAGAYTVRKDDQRIDMDQVAALAREHKPKLIIAGGSAYARAFDFAAFRKIADEVGAIFMVDMAHYAGLVAGGAHPSPMPHAHVVTTTTHKTLRGPRGGMILSRDEAIGKKALNSAVFPGLQGGPLMHVIAAKAVAFGEALQPEFKTYQKNVVENAKVLADVLKAGRSGHRHRRHRLTGKDAEAALGRAHITVNKNAIPNDPQKPFVTSGIRIGTPAMTTRGFKEIQAERLAHLVADILDAPNDEAVTERVKAEVAKLTAAFPVYAK
jgi:glycine hydroxymethyltransferase